MSMPSSILCHVCTLPMHTAVRLCENNHHIDIKCAEKIYGKVDEEGKLVLPSGKCCRICQETVTGYRADVEFRQLVENILAGLLTNSTDESTCSYVDLEQTSAFSEVKLSHTNKSDDSTIYITRQHVDRENSSPSADLVRKSTREEVIDRTMESESSATDLNTSAKSKCEKSLPIAKTIPKIRPRRGHRRGKITVLNKPSAHVVDMPKIQRVSEHEKLESSWRKLVYAICVCPAVIATLGFGFGYDMFGETSSYGVPLFAVGVCVVCAVCQETCTMILFENEENYSNIRRFNNHVYA